MPTPRKRDREARTHYRLQEMVEAAARWMYVDAWASEWDNAASNGCVDDLPWPPGAQLFDYAPETPDEMIAEARKLLRDIERQNHISLPDWAAENGLNRERCGELIVMEALGHGHGLWAEVDDHGLKIPRIEVQVEVPELAAAGCYD